MKNSIINNNGSNMTREKVRNQVVEEDDKEESRNAERTLPKTFEASRGATQVTMSA